VTIVFLSGVLTLGYAIAAVYFLRFWREARDPLFAWFSAAFAILAVQRMLIVALPDQNALYAIRLAAFVMILVAIVQKNRRG
jgi:uncharacterized protein DUF5985